MLEVVQIICQTPETFILDTIPLTRYDPFTERLRALCRVQGQVSQNSSEGANPRKSKIKTKPQKSLNISQSCIFMEQRFPQTANELKAQQIAMKALTSEELLKINKSKVSLVKAITKK